MIEFQNTDKLPKDVCDKFLPYLQSLINIHGDNIKSVCIYGSATGANYVETVSDINSVVIFRKLEFTAMKESLKTVNEGINKKISAPLFLTKTYIDSSLDVFPIEFLDMKENHVLLYGEDILSSLDINGEHLRLFCEQQIKGKLVRIRQAYLEIGLKRKGMESLLKESLNSLIPVFRNLIRLKSQTPSVKKIEIIEQLCQEFGLDENVFLPIYKDSTDDEKINNQEVVVFLEKYIDEIRKLAAKVDRI